MMLTQRISVLAHDFTKQCHVAPVRVEEKAARQRRTMTNNYTGMNIEYFVRNMHKHDAVGIHVFVVCTASAPCVYIQPQVYITCVLIAFKINPPVVGSYVFFSYSLVSENLTLGCTYSCFWRHGVIFISGIVFHFLPPLSVPPLSLPLPPLPLRSPSFPYCSCRSRKKAPGLLWLRGCDW